MGRLPRAVVLVLAARACAACVFDSSALPGPEQASSVDRSGDRRVDLSTRERVAAPEVSSLGDRPVIDQPAIDQRPVDYGPPPACGPKTAACPFWAPFCCDQGNGTSVCASTTTGCQCGKSGSTTCIWPYDNCCDTGDGPKCHTWLECNL